MANLQHFQESLLLETGDNLLTEDDRTVTLDLAMMTRFITEEAPYQFLLLEDGTFSDTLLLEEQPSRSPTFS